VRASTFGSLQGGEKRKFRWRRKKVSDDKLHLARSLVRTAQLHRKPRNENLIKRAGENKKKKKKNTF
jgi:hypothetical protein